jgi:hypothetical protein
MQMKARTGIQQLILLVQYPVHYVPLGAVPSIQTLTNPSNA